MGQAAATLLVSQLDSGPAGDDELLFEPELVVRETTAPAPATDRATAAPSPVS